MNHVHFVYVHEPRWACIQCDWVSIIIYFDKSKLSFQTKSWKKMSNFQAMQCDMGLNFLQPFIKVKDKICTAQFCCIWSTLGKCTCWNFKAFLPYFSYLRPCNIMKTNFICKSCCTDVTINSVNTFILNFGNNKYHPVIKNWNMSKKYEKLN